MAERYSKAPNFLSVEKEVLIELLQTHKYIIESKRNDSTMIAKKERAWKKIADEFHSRIGVHYRDARQLKGLWKNLKTKARLQSAREKHANAGAQTGESPMDDLSRRVAEITECGGTGNPFDDDAYGDGVPSLEDDNSAPGELEFVKVEPASPVAMGNHARENNNTMVIDNI